MNEYQKATILLSGTFFPLVLLFLNAMGYARVWLTASIGIGLIAAIVYALRNVPAE